ncbi:1490_t:CDS:10 [Funneliformis geosporum]|uniref:1490_t:CDS:1 n=1 Tax=Funneliformis geosporum TaxID=1117311 RepID=A0A9W4SFR1_9GLOM|nr:1490_t:CDS:10 [Funneliformis geosporum]
MSQPKKGGLKVLEFYEVKPWLELPLTGGKKPNKTVSTSDKLWAKNDRQLWKQTNLRVEIKQMLNVPPALGALSRRSSRGQRSRRVSQGQKVGEIHSLGRFVVGIGSIHQSGKRYSLKGKKGLENICDLEPYCPKPPPLSKKAQYFQKKAKLEERVAQNPRQDLLNICYICLVYFVKETETIKAHLVEKDLAADQSEKIKQLSQNIQDLENNLAGEKATNNLFQQKLSDLENSLLALAKNKLKGKAEYLKLQNNNIMEDKEKVEEISAELIDNIRKEAGIIKKLEGGELDLRDFANLEKIKVSSYMGLSTPITSIKLVKNSEKLKSINISNNNIQPNDIEMFSGFINLESLLIGTEYPNEKYNRFFGNLNSLKNMPNLSYLCIEATDVDGGLEYLQGPLRKPFVEDGRERISCIPHRVDAKVKKKYQDKSQLITELETKITQTQTELQTAKIQEADKTKKIRRLESSLRLLTATKTRLETELATEQQQHNQTKTNFQSQLRDLATILFPLHPLPTNINFADLKSQIQKNIQSQIQQIINLQKALVEEGKHRQRNFESAKAGAERVKEKNEELKLIQQKNKELATKISELEISSQNQTKQITQLETNNQQLLKLLQTTEQELTNTKNQLTQIQEKITHLEQQKTQTNQTITNLESQIEVKKGELQQGKDTNNKLFSELTTAKNQSATNQEKIKQLQSKIKLLEQQKTTYQTKYDNEAINFDLSLENQESTYKNLYLLRGKGKKESKFLEQVKKEMNIAQNIELSPHTLRRCFATHQVISGMPLPVLQKVLGHSKVSTTALYIRDGDLENLVKFRPV